MILKVRASQREFCEIPGDFAVCNKVQGIPVYTSRGQVCGFFKQLEFWI